MKTSTLTTLRLLMTAVVLAAGSPAAFAADMKAEKSNAKPAAGEMKQAEQTEPEPKGEETEAVAPKVQSKVEKSAAEKRAQLLTDAQSALDQTNQALQALDEGKKDEALAALEKVTGKLDLIVARDPALALAPVGVSTIVRDLYAGPDTAKKAVDRAEGYLEDGKVQQARALLAGLASESEVRVTNLPLATYPEAIKAVAPLIDAGKIDEAKAALTTALSTLVIESFVMPLPPFRANAILAEAEMLAEKSDRSEEENKRLHEMVEAAREELKLGEVLGYGTKEDYGKLYGQLDEIQKKTEGGKSGKGFFDKIEDSLKNFKDRVFD